MTLDSLPSLLLSTLDRDSAEAAALAPEVTILIPTMNEEVTIEAFLAWCREGIERAGVIAEIVIVDSSTDRTAEKAAAMGARVVRSPRRGLGRAYQEGILCARGRLVLMGDADCTYDFREIEAFVRKYREGCEFIMGSRFRGSIEAGSMPGLHRYFGTPVTTWILNRLYSTHFSDIHCGMRAVTREALLRMRIASESWEYASEMVLKAVHMKLRIAEVPVRFLKDPDGRVSHHKRSGWLSPWKAGWINLRVMLTHGADFFTVRPGLALLALGLGLILPATFGPFRVGPVTVSLYWMLVGLTLSVVGAQTAGLGCLAQILHDYSGSARRRWLAVFSYNRSMVCSIALALGGIVFVAPLVREYWVMGLALPREIARPHHMAITGLLMLMMAFTNFVVTLLVHAASAAYGRTR